MYILYFKNFEILQQFILDKIQIILDNIDSLKISEEDFITKILKNL